MSNLLHFAKVFGICSAIAMTTYVFVVFRWGFSVGWVGAPRPPLWAIQMMFWLWPIIPAFLIAALWEISRAVGLRVVR